MTYDAAVAATEAIGHPFRWRKQMMIGFFDFDLIIKKMKLI